MMQNKQVLIICYYWPPAGGPGVQRWLKFVKYFKEFGIVPTIFVPENPNYPLIDESFSSEVPSDLDIIRFPIKEPHRYAKWISRKKTETISRGIITEKKPSRLEKLLLYIRGNLFIPDARIGWVKPSVKYLTRFLQDSGIDTVITSGPPHSLHLIGLQLQQELDVKWIADFRDPWTTIHYHKSLRLTKASAAKHKEMERAVLNSADAIVVTSENTKQEFSAITQKPITVITNGFDTSEEIIPNPDATFSIVHVGSLLSERNPEVLWKVLSELCSENKEFAEKLQLRLVGAVGEEITQRLALHNLIDHTECTGYVSHKQAQQFQYNARVLLLIEMDRPETRAIIPGKLFEYLVARRPILALGPAGSNIQDIIEETRSGVFLTYSDEKELKQQLSDYFEAFLQNSLEVPAPSIEKYSRRELTRSMAELIHDVSGTRG